MRWQFLVMIVLGLLVSLKRAEAASGEPAQVLTGGIIARVHFAGTEQIRADKNAADLNAIGALPETAALRADVLRKLASAPRRFLGSRAAGTNDGVALILPMLEDLLRSESFAEARDSTNAAPEMALAVRLDERRAALWQTNLAVLLGSWTGLPLADIKFAGFAGRELRKHDSPNVIRFFRANEWVVLGWGDGELRLLPEVMQRIKDRQRPVDRATGYWLDAALDWPALAPHDLAPESFQLPKMRLVVQGRKGDDGRYFVRPELTMQFARPLGLALKAWQIPTNLIHNPIVSFTAIRGLASGWGDLPMFKALGAAPVPDQCYIWAMDGLPYETCLAASVTDGTNYLQRLRPGVIAMVDLEHGQP